ncbi:MAG: STAS domain-containing protein [Nocardioides sp.]|nr:STAS domain-containing protein [Nocardioides sp.]
MELVDGPTGREGRPTMALVVRGDLDVSAGPAVGAVVERLRRSRPTVVLVDLEQVDFVDTAGLHWLRRALRAAVAHGADVGVLAESPAVRRLLRLGSEPLWPPPAAPPVTRTRGEATRAAGLRLVPALGATTGRR